MSEVDIVRHSLPMKLADGKRHVWPTLAKAVNRSSGEPLEVDGEITADKALNSTKLGGVAASEYVTKSDVKSEVTEAVEERIAQITDGEAADMAEVISARTDEDGVVHASLKTRIDSGFSSLKGQLIERTKNIFNIEEVEIGKAWNGDSNVSRAIAHVKVEPSTSYSVSSFGYDFDLIFIAQKINKDDKTTVGGSYQYTSDIRTSFTTSDQANYLVIQFTKSDITLESFAGFKMLIEEGSDVFTDYTPYEVTPDFTARNYVFNVKEFGAKGDGVTDDTAAFKRAIDQASAIRRNFYVFSNTSAGSGIGFKLYIPSGKYLLSDTIKVDPFLYEYSGSEINSAPITIEGDGNTATILDFTNCGSSENGIEISGSMCAVKNLKVYSAKNYGISFSNRAWKGTVENVTAERCSNYGFYFGVNSFNMIVSHCLAYKCGQGGFRFSSGITSTTISNCYANTCSGVGFFFDDSINYSSIINCAVDSCGTSYRFGSYNYLAMINNGNESCGGSAIVCNGSCDITIMGHFDLNTNEGALIEVRGENNHIVASNIRTYMTTVENTKEVLISPEGVESNTVIANNVLYPATRTLKSGGIALTDLANNVVNGKTLTFNEDGTVSWS